MMPNDPVLQAAVQTAQYNLSTLQTLGNAPTPERTYDAITLSLNKRFSKNWFARASYTYSRLIGNYEGLYQNETNYFAPNGSNAYDTPDLYVNQNGPLPNDRPHLFKLDGYYTPPGRPRQFASVCRSPRARACRATTSATCSRDSPYQLVFLLPRGDAGRTPTVTELERARSPTGARSDPR